MPSFAHPIWLLAAPFLLYGLWVLQRESFAEGSPANHRLWLWIRAILALIIVGALAGFQFRYTVQQSQTVLVLDASNSIAPDQRIRMLADANKVISQIHTPDQVGIVVFGADAAVERSPPRRDRFRRSNRRLIHMGPIWKPLYDFPPPCSRQTIRKTWF